MLYAMDSMLLKAKTAAVKAFKNERGDVNVVAIVVLIAVAVSLALLFKQQIKGVITNVINQIKNKASTAIN